MTTWFAEICKEMARQDETWGDVVGSTFKPGEMHAEFDGLHGEQGCAFTLWTTHRVYFPTSYDAETGAISVPRNPCDEVTVSVEGPDIQ